jgi:hypothetical protein
MLLLYKSLADLAVLFSPLGFLPRSTALEGNTLTITLLMRYNPIPIQHIEKHDKFFYNAHIAYCPMVAWNIRRNRI